MQLPKDWADMIAPPVTICAAARSGPLVVVVPSHHSVNDVSVSARWLKMPDMKLQDMTNITRFCSCPLQLVAATIRMTQRHRLSRFTSTITLYFDSTPATLAQSFIVAQVIKKKDACERSRWVGLCFKRPLYCYCSMLMLHQWNNVMC